MNHPPQAIEAESAVLGACMLYPQAVCIAVQALSAEDFFKDAHIEIFKVICELSSKGMTVDHITVSELAIKKGKADVVGGIAYVSGLVDTVIGWSGTKNHCAIVRGKAMARRAIQFSHELIDACINSDPKSAIEQFGLEISMLNRGSKAESTPVANITGKVMRQIESVIDGTANYGLQTGFTDIDRRIVGMAPGDLIILAARPSMGKTALALNIADHVAQQGTVVQVFSMEMSSAQLVTRLLTSYSGVSGDSLRKGNVPGPMLEKVRSARQQIDALPLVICDKSNLSIGELQSISKFQHMKTEIGLVVVDYMQLMTAGKSENRTQELSAISRGLKALAKDLNCPVIALSQLSRAVESRTDKRPMNSDLRESGAIEQDADIIAFIYRDEMYNKADDNPLKGIAEIIISKQRQGSTGIERLTFMGEFSRFADYARGY